MPEWLQNLLNLIFSNKKPKPNPVPTPPASNWQVQMLVANNKLRTNPLQLNADLNKAAQQWANTMAQENRMYHSPSWAIRIHKTGFTCGYLGECLEEGLTDPTQVINSWYSDMPHRVIITNNQFNFVGYGQAVSNNGTHYWVADYGS